MNFRFKFMEHERSVVSRCGQTKAVIYKHVFSGLVSVVHSADLRKRGVGLVHKQYKILGEKVQQSIRRFSGGASVKVSRVIFNACAGAYLAEHLHVVARSLDYALRFQEFLFIQEHFLLCEHIGVNLAELGEHGLSIHGVMRRGEYHGV